MEFFNYFTSIFSSSGFIGEVGSCLQSIDQKVTEEMNVSLLKPFLAEEIHSTLFQMASTKASGPDGFSVGFY
jgi:hypothetical protein